jgi:hypothetical protein
MPIAFMCSRILEYANSTEVALRQFLLSIQVDEANKAGDREKADDLEKRIQELDYDTGDRCWWPSHLVRWSRDRSSSG